MSAMPAHETAGQTAGRDGNEDAAGEAVVVWLTALFT